jgi:diguanylate cyclase (GGDEF)-like protein/PAS domain S-box-containing protein
LISKKINFFKTILTSNQTFNENEQLLKYKFQLLNSIFLAGSIILFTIGLIRINNPKTFTLGLLEVGLSITFLTLLSYLRKDKKYFNKVSTIAIFILFIGFIAITILLDHDKSKMQWFAIFLTTVFLIKGYKSGLQAYVLTIFTLIVLHFLPNIELSLSFKELIMTLTSYGVISIFLTFSELKHERSKQNIEKSKKSINKINNSLQKQLKNIKAYETLFNKSKDPISIIENGIFIDFNDAAVEILGYKSKEEILSIKPSKLSPKFQEDSEPSYTKARKMIDYAIKNGGHQFEWQHLNAQNEIVELNITLTPMFINGREIIHVVWRDIRQQKELEKEINRKNKELFLQLRRDSLSNLPNKLTLDEDLQKADKNISLLYLNIDNFNTMTNVFGHKFSDEIIIKVSNILKTLEKKSIKLYHLGSYRFSFIIKNPYNNEELYFIKSMKIVFEQLDINYKDVIIPISVSVGVAKGNSEKIIFQAKTALKEALEYGKNSHKIFEFDKKREENQKNNIYWLRKIKEIIANDQLIVYYQPIIDNETQEISKYESLIRAVDNGKIISPFFFLDAAKSTGMLESITKNVIEKSFKMFKDEPYSFSINITETDLNGEYLIDFLSKKLKKYQINPNRVILEILENISSVESKRTLKQLTKLKDMGFQIAIDDFGAEASNFSRLLSIEANIIKIDGQFIKNIHTDQKSYKIVETIVSLAKKLNAKTVAEFVHNKEVYQITKKLGVDFSQGYYFQEPLPTIESKVICTAECI